MERSRRTWMALVAGILCASAVAEDWPTYLHDNARSSMTAEKPKLPLQERWVFTPRHAPEPAWPESTDQPSRVRFDDAYHVAVAGKLLYFGSSADHKVYALDAAQGKEQWSAFTGGPVRVTPSVWEGRVYAASDDGWAYCFKADSGEVLWKFHAAPDDRKALGHGRMISRWPMRTGVLVEGGTAYFCAGLFPAEGIYVYAVGAKDGQLLWKNDTTGQMYVLQPHPTAEGFTGISPQGPLLASASRLYVPTGRSVPAAFDRTDGRFLFWHSVTVRFGGCWALLTDDLLINSPGQLVGYDAPTGEKFAQFSGLRMIVTRDTSYLLTPAQISAVDRKAHAEYCQTATRIGDELSALGMEDKSLALRVKRLATRQAELKKAGNDLTEAELAQIREMEARQAEIKEKRAALAPQRSTALKAAEATTRWQTLCVCPYAMILAGDTLFAGGDDQVLALDAATGKQVWTGKVAGKACGLAFSGGRLFVSTDKGTIHCFEHGWGWARKIAQPVAQQPYPKDDLTPVYAARAQEILRDTGVTRGYCLLLGCGDGRLAYELARRSDLRIYATDPDAAKVEAARKVLDAAGLHGVRVTVEQASPERLPYADYFANLIVVDEPAASPDTQKAVRDEILRVLKPCGGVACLRGPGESPSAWEKIVRGPIEGTGDWTHEYANTGNTACSDDKALECPLGLLWYGEPGPRKMINRHCQAPAPLCIGGRVFVCGNDLVTAFDAYNGVPCWEKSMPGCRRLLMSEESSNFAAAPESVYVAIGDHCLRLNGDTGETMATWPLPPDPNGVARQWGYLACEGDLLLGSASPTFTGRTMDEDTQIALTKARVPLAVIEKLLPLRGKPFLTREEFEKGVAEAVGERDMAAYKDKLLDSPGIPHGGMVSHYVFALDRKSGECKWIYPVSDGYVGNIAIAIGRGRMYLVETEAETKKTRMAALNLQSGEKLWAAPLDTAYCGAPLLNLAYKDDTLVVGGSFGGQRLVAVSAKDGKEVWSRPIRYTRRPLIVGSQVIVEPLACDLKSGKDIRRLHPVTGLEVPWQFQRSYGCGAVSASGNCLFFRSASIGYYDLKNDGGTSSVGGIRPSCWISVIGAAGLAIAPEGSSGCTCSYSMQSTAVLQPIRTPSAWGVFSSQGAMTPVRRLAINFGAPGDRKTPQGDLWLGYPRPCQRFGLKPDLQMEFLPDFGYFQVNPQGTPIQGTDIPWVFTSGCYGLSRCAVPLDARDQEGLYTVRLAFAEDSARGPGQRVFDVKIQDQVALKDFDILKEAGGPNRAVVKEFPNVKVKGSLVVELVPKTDNPPREQSTVINGMEVLRCEAK